MNYLTILTFILAFALTAHVEAVEAAAAKQEQRYDARVQNWAEGTISSLDKDGRVVVRGMENPYTSTYVSYMRDYFSAPPADREGKRRELREKYLDGLTYSWSDEHLDNFILNAPYPEDVRVLDESKRYGADVTSWNFNNDATNLRYSDLRIGDRVVVGFNNANTIDRILLVNPTHKDSDAKVKADLSAQPPPANIDPQTGVHIMNLPSNVTNTMRGSKSGSDSGHIMNSGSNSTNQPLRNPYDSTLPPRQ